MDCLNDHRSLGSLAPVGGASNSLADLMGRLSGELAALADATERMHDLVADGEGAGRNTAAFVRGAQSIDYCQQHLAALSQFLDSLSQEIDPAVRVDLQGPLESLRLSDLRHRLSPGASAVAFASQDAGEMELL